tara:strand:+ start:185 stop:532 length:348 start_codon:yes stop_codon:yes gene_type:complete
MRVLFFIFLLIFISCSNNNEEDYFSLDCDENNISYSSGIPRSISEIVSSKCLACHLEDNSISFLALDSYDALIIHTNLDDIINDVNNPMPPIGSIQLTDCEITQIENWVHNNFPL